MLTKVSVGRHCCSSSTNVENYRPLVGDELVDEIATLAGELKGVKIGHVNSTAFGGGVAELLSRHLPVLLALGISADWRLIHGEPEFFTVTKAFHNALQGAHYDLRERERNLYLDANRQAAQLLETEYDVIIVHDPQPAAIRHFAGSRGAKWVWRCHIDSSAADPEVRDFLKPFIAEYDRLVFTMADFFSCPASTETARSSSLRRSTRSRRRTWSCPRMCADGRSPTPGSISTGRCSFRSRGSTPGKTRWA